jgi:hypothetical protein
MSDLIGDDLTYLEYALICVILKFRLILTQFNKINLLNDRCLQLIYKFIDYFSSNAKQLYMRLVVHTAYPTKISPLMKPLQSY